MAGVVVGPISWSLDRDEEGHRTYKIKHLVRVDVGEGPATALLAPGLPTIGSYWTYGNETDSWAFCTPGAKVAIYKTEDEPVHCYTVEQVFTTQPTSRCQDASIDNPLAEPVTISGGFIHEKEEASYDRNNVLAQSSSHEPLRGPLLQFANSFPTVQISQNVLALGIENFTSLLHKVNASTLWGMPKRCIKFSDVTWSRKVYGRCCFYYTRNLVFDININTFDPIIPDEGTRVLRGWWDLDPTSPTYKTYIIDGDADPDNPQDFIVFQDINGNPCRTPLDGQGRPALVNTWKWTTDPEDVARPQALWRFEKYEEDDSNFLTLGIPVSL